MTKIAVELVPRDKDIFAKEVREIHDKFASVVSTINVPDLLSCDVRSVEGATIAKGQFNSVMPHLRAMDFDFTQAFPLKKEIQAAGIDKVLVVEGDPPQSMTYRVYPTVSTDIIKKIREELPEVKVYAGIDQYRSSMKDEDYRIRRKVLAGAQGFFTQPFFDLRYLEMYADLLDNLEDKEIYWGVSPVLSERSVSYWQIKNNVIFPKNFEPTLAWNIEFARKVIAFAKAHNHNVYLMPIKAKIMPYLEGVLK